MNRKIILAALAATVLFTFTGCHSRPPMAKAEPIILTTADLTIKLIPLNYDELKDRHGRNVDKQMVNPYIDFPGMLPKRRIVVFETEFSTTESTVEVTTNKISLEIGDKDGNGCTAEYLERLWMVYIDQTAWKHRIPSALRDTLLPREFVVSPGETVSGYLAFAEPYSKDGGHGLLRIPVATPNGDRGVLEHELWFSIDGTTPASAEEGSGIFSEKTDE